MGIEDVGIIWCLEWGTRRRFYTVYANAEKKYNDLMSDGYYKGPNGIPVRLYEIQIAWHEKLKDSQNESL